MSLQMTMPKANPKPGRREFTKKRDSDEACSICSGALVFDAAGTAVFCDECWERKCRAIEGD